MNDLSQLIPFIGTRLDTITGIEVYSAFPRDAITFSTGIDAIVSYTVATSQLEKDDRNYTVDTVNVDIDIWAKTVGKLASYTELIRREFLTYNFNVNVLPLPIEDNDLKRNRITLTANVWEDIIYAN